MKATLVVSVLVAVLAQGAVAQTPGYHLLGFPEGTSQSYATGVSADGRWVSGNAFRYVGPTVQGFTGMVWSEAAGRADFLTETTTLQWSQSNGISGDGSVAVGIAGFFGAGPGYDNRAFRRTGPGVYENLGLLPGYDESTATATNDDGSVVVGYNYLQSHRQDPSRRAFRWTPATGMQPLAFPFPQSDFQGVPNAISRDGSTIVGYAAGFGETPTAWDAVGGVRALPLLTGMISGEAIGTNHDGSIIVGRSGGFGVVWTGDTISQVFPNPTGFGTKATHVSDDGSIILGSMLSFATQVQTPVVWLPESTAWLPLTDYLAGQGFPVPEGWTLGGNFSMSADGRTFVGAVGVAGGDGGAVVITVPSTATASVLLLNMSLLLTRRRRS